MCISLNTVIFFPKSVWDSALISLCLGQNDIWQHLGFKDVVF